MQRHGCGGNDRKAASKDTESPEKQLLLLAQETVAPSDGGPHGPLPGRRRPARPRQRQAVVQASGEAFDPERLDARRGELDRKRQAVKPSANLDDQRSVRIGQGEVFDGRRDTFDEQLHSGKGRRLGGRERSRWLRAAERSQAVLVLARYPERLPTGGQDGDAWRSGEKRRRQAGRRLDVLAIV